VSRFDYRTSVRRTMLGACAVASVVALSACGSSSSSSTSSPAAASSTASANAPASSTTISGQPLKGKTIALISAAPLEYYNYSAKAAQLAVEALGGTVKNYQSNGNPQTELANVQTAITQGVNGVVEIPISTAGERTELQNLKNAHIPAVMLYGYDPSLANDAAGFVEVNFGNYGELVGKAMSKVVPTGQVAIITGLPGRGEVPAGTAGLEAGFGNTSRVVSVVPGNWDRQKAFSQTQSLMTKYPNLKGIMVQNDDMAIGTVQALGSKINQVAVSSMNGSPEGIAMLKAGKFKVLAGNSIPVESSQAVRYLANAISGKSTSPKLCNTPISIDTPTEITSKGWVPTPALIKEGLQTPCANVK